MGYLDALRGCRGLLHLGLLLSAPALAVSVPPLARNGAGLVARGAAASSSSDGTCGIPDSAWDTHHHIIDPERYPLLPGSEYDVKGEYAVWDNVVFEHRIGCEHVVMIQPSVYGNNNTLMIDTLKAYGPARAHAVVVFDPANTTAAQLREWHALGVRGVRVNLETTGADPPAEELARTLRAYADAVRPLSWAVELYVAMASIPGVEDVVANLGVPVVFDHMGHPDIPKPSDPPKPVDPYKLEGFASFARLLRGGSVWAKISGAYRLSKVSGPDYRDVDPVVLELFRVAPSRLMYGSDWPHTRFEGLDIKPWTEHLVELTGGDEQLKNGLFRDNAVELWTGRDA